MTSVGDPPVADVVLSLKDIDKSFPGVRALAKMSIDLRHGEVHAVCGENGAGKSTLMKIITGVYQPDGGSIALNGKQILIRNPNDAYAKGIAIIFQETSLFPDLTVLENIFMGHEIHKPLIGSSRFATILNYDAMRARASEICAKLGVDIDLDRRVSELGIATKQMVEIAKALSFDSSILILDEPTAALTS
ncbi:MAG: ATP-binding cassette domain-containing protein, partial [Propionivibrio sp.]